MMDFYANVPAPKTIAVKMVNRKTKKVILDIPEVIAPETWSYAAVQTFADKYLRKAMVPSATKPRSQEEFDKYKEFAPSVPTDDATFGMETSVYQVVHRLAGCWTYHLLANGYFELDVYKPLNYHDGSPKSLLDIARSFYTEVSALLLNQVFAPNSPQWFNTGLSWAYGIRSEAKGQYYRVNPATNQVEEVIDELEFPQPHACFIQSVDDSLVDPGGLMDSFHKEAKLFKYGSGTGSNFSAIRGEGELLSGGGRSSGVVSFLKVGDRSAGSIKSGGTTRRAAKLVLLNADHPDIEKFVSWKMEEETKVAALVLGYQLLKEKAFRSTNRSELNEIEGKLFDRVQLLRDQGLDQGDIDSLLGEELDFDWEGEAYATVSGQNANLSVSVTDEFMQKSTIKDGDPNWNLINRTDGKVAKAIKASDLINKMAIAAWHCADPGIVFRDTVNQYNTCAASGEIVAANPCIEYMFLNDTACNLASINLVKFLVPEGGFSLPDFQRVCMIATFVLDISNTMASFPSKEIASNTYKYRTVGLGFANLGAMLMRSGIPYDGSTTGDLYPGSGDVTAVISSFMTATTYQTGALIAGAFHSKAEETKQDILYSFPEFEKNKASFISVMEKHKANILKVLDRSGPVFGIKTFFGKEVRQCESIWSNVIDLADAGYARNAQATVVAPTGTIGLIMDCDTTGIEPDFALAKYKTLAGGGSMVIVNQSVEPTLRNLGYTNQDQLDEFKDLALKHGVLTRENAPEWFDFDRYGSVFATANQISWSGHLNIVAHAQPHLSGSISKTINMPETATVADIMEVFYYAWNLKVKAISVYRDKSKLSQVLNSIGSKATDTQEVVQSNGLVWGSIKKLPSRRFGFTQKVNVGGHPMYIRTGEYEDKKLGEIFIDLADEGSAMRSWGNSFAIAVSIGLQHGTPLSAYVDALANKQSEPNGIVRGSEHIRFAPSVPAYIMRELAIYYDNDLRWSNTAEKSDATVKAEVKPTESYKYTGDQCAHCGNWTLVQNGTCKRCTTCGETTGCS